VVALVPPQDGFVTAEVAHSCHQCEGMWVEGNRVGVAYPALRHHAKRIVELIELGAIEHGATCPRCDVSMIQFPFFDLWLDLCDSCHGMWVDGYETRFVGKTAAHEDGLPRKGGATGYRDNAAAQASTAFVKCTDCLEDVHPRRTMLTAVGPVCDHCVEVDDMARELQDESGLRSLADKPRRLLSWLTKVLDAKGRLIQRGAPK
jgi:Zn-finger nucleic acid-binding protein